MQKIARSKYDNKSLLQCGQQMLDLACSCQISELSDALGDGGYSPPAGVHPAPKRFATLRALASLSLIKTEIGFLFEEVFEKRGSPKYSG